MREIKFRVWDYQRNDLAKESEALESMGFDFGVNDYYDNIAGERSLRWHFMQYTGLKDKNGIEIYEGDILNVSTDKPIVVAWSNKFASFILNKKGWAYSHWFGESCNPEDCEVIGNIHKNPELL